MIEQDALLRSQGMNNTNITIPDSQTDFNVYVFSGIIASVFIFGLLRALMYFKVAVDAAKRYVVYTHHDRHGPLRPFLPPEGEREDGLRGHRTFHLLLAKK